MKRLELRAVATLWQCDAEHEISGPNAAVVWEPLNVVAPLDARPHCCYANTVIFYNATEDQEIARCDTHDLNTAAPTMLFLAGQWWQVGRSSVVQRDGRWCMRREVYANTQLARELNHGRELDRRAQIARVN